MEYFNQLYFYAHIVASLCVVLSLILLIVNYKKLFRLDGIELVRIFSVLAIAVTAYGQSHLTFNKIKSI